MKTNDNVKKGNSKIFIFIIILIAIILLLISLNITKILISNLNKNKITNIDIKTEDIISNSVKKTDNEIIEKDINEITNIKEEKNNTTDKEIDIKEESTEKSENELNNKKTREFKENVAFIGDSRTQAFLMYTGLNNVTDYTNIGLMVDTAVTKKIVTNSSGEKITLLEDLKYKNIDTIYIMLGINELGWVYSSIFIKNYEELIDKIKEIKPDCEIILQSIIPVTKTKSDNDSIYNNNRITEYNTLIKEMANRKKIKFIDLVPVLADESGNLPENASPDGIHLNKEYCLKWLEYLKNN